MGTLTLENFRDELTVDLRDRTDLSDAAGTARLNRWINQSYRHVSLPRVHPHWELEGLVEVPLTQDDFDYDLSTAAAYVTREVLGVRSARYVENPTDSFTALRNQLRPRGLSWFNVRRHRTGPRPSHFTVARKQLLVSPGPDAAADGNIVALEVWFQPTPLVGDADTTVLLDWWDEIILLGARWLAEVHLHFGELAEATKQNYVSLINETPERSNLGIEDNQGWFPDLETGEPIMPRS